MKLIERKNALNQERHSFIVQASQLGCFFFVAESILLEIIKFRVFLNG